MTILLVGAYGQMGNMIAEVAASRGHSIAAGVDLITGSAPFPVYSSLDKVMEPCDLLIDFSTAENLKNSLAYAKNKGIPTLFGATGMNDADRRLLEEYASYIPIFYTGNYSLGINLLELLAKKAASVLGDSFDAEIVERHHNRKKDAPSGTALMLADKIREGCAEEKTLVCGRHGMVGARDSKEIGIHSVRGGTVVGEHEVGFYGEDEIITLSHSARSRKVFAVGAVKAAEWLIGQPCGKYGMDDYFKEIIK